jgi:hypothetical protein
MESNFFDEMFERINILEAENKILKEELKNIHDDNYINVEKFITMNPNEKLNQLHEFKKNIKLDELIKKKNFDSKDKKYFELTINFKSFDELNSLEITGDFTNWKKMQMQKVLNLKNT